MYNQIRLQEAICQEEKFILNFIKKITRDSCLVRGYWGDIIVSPFISFGVETDYEPEKTKLFKVTNMQ